MSSRYWKLGALDFRVDLEPPTTTPTTSLFMSKAAAPESPAAVTPDGTSSQQSFHFRLFEYSTSRNDAMICPSTVPEAPPCTWRASGLRITADKRAMAPVDGAVTAAALGMLSTTAMS